MTEPSESQKFDASDAEDSFRLKGRTRRNGRRTGNGSENGQRKSGRRLSPLSPALPPGGPCLGSLWSVGLAGQFGVGQPFADDLERRPQRKAVSIVQRVILCGPIVEPENLLSDVAIQMERFYSNVSALQGRVSTRLQKFSMP